MRHLPYHVDSGFQAQRCHPPDPLRTAARRAHRHPGHREHGAYLLLLPRRFRARLAIHVGRRHTQPPGRCRTLVQGPYPHTQGQDHLSAERRRQGLLRHLPLGPRPVLAGEALADLFAPPQRGFQPVPGLSRQPLHRRAQGQPPSVRAPGRDSARAVRRRGEIRRATGRHLPELPPPARRPWQAPHGGGQPPGRIVSQLSPRQGRAGADQARPHPHGPRLAQPQATATGPVWPLQRLPCPARGRRRRPPVGRPRLGWGFEGPGEGAVRELPSGRGAGQGQDHRAPQPSDGQIPLGARGDKSQRLRMAQVL
jgi:hypothetical protein